MLLSSCATAQTVQMEMAPDSNQIKVIPSETAKSAASEYALNRDEVGRALRGYDPVAYFKNGKAIPGNDVYSLQWQNAIWSFSTPENRDAFADDPEKYAPANGGYCTFGVVLLKKFDGDPQVWLIHEEKLYVFLNSEVQAKFLQDRPGNFDRVSSNWPLIKDKSPESLQSS